MINRESIGVGESLPTDEETKLNPLTNWNISLHSTSINPPDLAEILHLGDMLGNLRVRISGPWVKTCPQRNVLNLFLLETFKKDHSRGKRRGALVFQSMWPFTSQKCLSFPELPFHFPEVRFCFLELSFCFPEVTFYFSKMLYRFPESPFSFSEVPSFYFLSTFFSKNAFFPADCTFSWVLLRTEI